ncbi:MAG: hypothetical protein IT445_20990 [Phycisphaeraceae bacterium]|nr:hypothetical protein [Phycisphaeraceae bacterium]
MDANKKPTTDEFIRELQAQGWTVSALRQEMDQIDQDLDEHLEYCELCIEEHELFCPMAERLQNRRLEMALKLLLMDGENLGRRSLEKKARR